jgi:glycosyltransferase involved in cell wall biosynthesis
MIRILHHLTDGLTNDARVLKAAIKSSRPSCTVETIKYHEIDVARETRIHLVPSHTQFLLEHLYENALAYGKINVFVPNIEWMNTKDIDILSRHPNILVLAKTHVGYHALSSLLSHKIMLTGWDSRDMYIQSVLKLDQCVHVKGVSKNKHSQLLLDTWISHPEWPVLHIVSYGDESRNGCIRIPHKVNVSSNVILYQYRMSDDDLKHLMNTCKFHICPSYTEGFGHYINEGLSTNAIVLTTDHPPMNELVTNKHHLINSDNPIDTIHLGSGMRIDEADLVIGINKMLCSSLDINFDLCQNRKGFLHRHHTFHENVSTLLKYINV